MALMKFREQNQVKWMGTRPAHNGVQVLSTAYADNSTVGVYAVPVGKTFFLTYYSWGTIAVAAGASNLYIIDDLAALQLYLVDQMVLAGSAPESKACSLTFPIEMLAGWVVVLTSNAAGLTVRGNVAGWYDPPP